MHSGQASIRPIQPYTVKTIRYLNKLKPNVFLEEVRRAITEYEALYSVHPLQASYPK
jgi:hypothetical protein